MVKPSRKILHLLFPTSLSKSEAKMSYRYRYLKQMQWLLPYISSGNQLWGSGKRMSLWVPSLSTWVPSCFSEINEARILKCKIQSSRYLSTLQVSNKSSCSDRGGLLPFVEASRGEIQGPDHCWLNVMKESEDVFQRDGSVLILAGDFVGEAGIVVMLERAKSLQQRFPQLRVMGFHVGSLNSPATAKAALAGVVMKEFITFPILLSYKSFPEIENDACYILSKDFTNSRAYYENDQDPAILDKSIEELQMQEIKKITKKNAGLPDLKRTWFKPTEVIKEPILCSPLRNLLLSLPGCISVAETGSRLFLSDTNHHRILILDENGNILDCIGSSPGFVDGGFESAKLLRPAATFYDDTEDCLYIVDSENHAIRRADMDRRILETLHPTYSISKKDISVWTWIMDKLQYRRNSSAESEEFDSLLLLFPWHILRSADNDLLIINHSLERLWILDSVSGKIKQCIEGYSEVVETCGQLITDKISLLKRIPSDWLERQTRSNSSKIGLPCPSLLSCVTTFQNQIVMCDNVNLRLLKLNPESGTFSNFKLSNFGTLGLPYWLSYPLEGVYSFAGVSGGKVDHCEYFKLLPGRIAIQVNLHIPTVTELVEPLQEGCIWRQAKGAAAEIHCTEDEEGSSEKVGIAQQWYDYLDNLAFTTQEIDISGEEQHTDSVIEGQDDKLHIKCTVNTSPGTSEVVLYAALYLKLRTDPDEKERSPENHAARIVDIMNSTSSRDIDIDSCIEFLMKSNRDLRDIVFVKPVHVRIKLDCLDHPKADNQRDIILTESSIEVDVSLNT